MGTKRNAGAGQRKKGNLRLSRKAKRTTALVSQTVKSVDAPAKPQAVLSSTARKPHVLPEKVAGKPAFAKRAAVVRRPTLQAKNTVHVRQRKKKKLSLHRRAIGKAAAFQQANKPLDLPATPGVVLNPPTQPGVSDNRQFEGTAGLEELQERRSNSPTGVAKPTATVLPREESSPHGAPSTTPVKTDAEAGKGVERELPADASKKFKRRVDRAVRLERRIEKLEAIVCRARKRVAAKGQAGKVTKFQRKPQTEPQLGKPVVPIEQGADAAALSELAEPGTDAASPASKKANTAAVPAEIDALQIVSDSSATETRVTREQVNKTEARDELPENTKEIDLKADSTACIDAASEVSAVLDAPAEATPFAFTQVEVMDFEGYEAQLEPPGNLDCRAENAMESAGDPASGIGLDEPATDRDQRPRKKVLVIDDDATMRMLLKMGLRSLDYECLTAENGKAAQEVLQTHRPDLILVDLLMPVMDGLTFLRWLRQSALDSTPVLVLTNVDTPRITQEALANGANSFACKPLHLKELLELMNQLLPDQ